MLAIDSENVSQIIPVKFLLKMLRIEGTERKYSTSSGALKTGDFN